MITIITIVAEAKKLKPFVGQAAILITAELTVFGLSLALFFTLPFFFLFTPTPASPSSPFLVGPFK